MVKTVTLGEIMLRLSPPGGGRLFQSPSLRTFFGGAEANVAVSLARFGLESFYVTRVPEGALGDAALGAVLSEGVRTEHVVRGGRRLGVYFAELGTGQRPMRVFYDRAGSAATEMEPGSFDWTAIFAGASWFHTTGITPALGPEALSTTRAALEAARAAGVTVSFDVNYRQQLWRPEEARKTLCPLLEHVDVLIANPAGLESGLGVRFPAGSAPEDLRTAASALARDFDLRHVAVTLRETPSASENVWSAALLERETGDLQVSRCHRVPMVDRIGAGDAFAAGLIYGLLVGRPNEETLGFAVAAGVLKHTIPGDFNLVSAEEVEMLAACEQELRD